MTEPASPIDTLLDLETRHEELLDQLAELDQQVEQVLQQWQSGREEDDTRRDGEQPPTSGRNENGTSM